MQHRVTPESAQAGNDLNVRSSDIFISTGIKSGTTLMQQICHQLRSGGDMDFVEINDVCPYLESSLDLGFHPDAEQKYEPRVFKTHHWESFTPKGGRYIVVVRHPYDVVISFFKFVENWMFDEGEISLETFTRFVTFSLTAPKSVLDLPSPFHHLASWWPRRHEKDVMLCCYEDLTEDLEGQVKQVAGFLGVTDPAVIAQAVEKSTFAFMKNHEMQFDESRFKRSRNEVCGVPPEAGQSNTKVRVGGGQRHLLSEELKAAIDEKWMDVVAPVVGAASFDEWREKWHKEQMSNSTES